jgi:hypothetical protein
MRSVSLSLRGLQLFSIGWQSMTCVLMMLLLPQRVLGVAVSIVGVAFGTAGILRGRPLWTNLSVLTMWTTFFWLIISQATLGSIEQYLPFTLLQSVMILFATEVVTETCKLRNQVSSEAKAIPSEGVELKPIRSGQQAFRHISRLGLLFASSYLLSLGLLFAGGMIASAVPLLADISLYIVVVSVSLSLLLLLREE